MQTQKSLESQEHVPFADECEWCWGSGTSNDDYSWEAAVDDIRQSLINKYEGRNQLDVILKNGKFTDLGAVLKINFNDGKTVWKCGKDEYIIYGIDSTDELWERALEMWVDFDLAVIRNTAEFRCIHCFGTGKIEY
jgi:hypothetical protein